MGLLVCKLISMRTISPKMVKANLNSFKVNMVDILTKYIKFKRHKGRSTRSPIVDYSLLIKTKFGRQRSY